MSDFLDDFVLVGQPQDKPMQPKTGVMTPAELREVREDARPATVRAGVHPAWVAVLAFLAVTFCLLWVSTWVSIPVPTPGPDVDPVDGAYVAIFYDDKEDYSQDQVTAISSAAVAQFLDETVTNWKKLDVDDLDELSGLHPIYSEMAEMHRSKLPWVVVRSGKKLGSEPIESADGLMDVVKRNVK